MNELFFELISDKKLTPNEVKEIQQIDSNFLAEIIVYFNPSIEVLLMGNFDFNIDFYYFSILLSICLIIFGIYCNLKKNNDRNLRINIFSWKVINHLFFTCHKGFIITCSGIIMLIGIYFFIPLEYKTHLLSSVIEDKASIGKITKK